MHCIQGSDAHRLRRDANSPKNLGVGDRATDVLLDEVSFEALKELFRSNDFARTRPHSATAEVEFDYVQQAREEGPNIVQAFHESAQVKGGKQYAIIADVCAFANTNGGTIYVGLSADPKQTPAGVPDSKRAVEELKSAIDRMLTPHLDCTVDAQPTRGKTILRVLVPRGDDAPYAVEDYKFYVRDEAETSLAVRDEIVQLVLRGLGSAGQAPAAPVEPMAEPAPAARVLPPSTGLEAVDPPRTGVEVVTTEERNGRLYHGMRDLRNGNTVNNVTRASARKLWHYALAEHETGKLKSENLHWQGDLALVKKTHRGGVTRYDLAQRIGGEVHVYYGVTEDGVHGPWKHVVGEDDAA
jgi:hypothetical protein